MILERYSFDSIELNQIEIPEEFCSKEMQGIFLFCFWMVYYAMKDAFIKKRIRKNKYYKRNAVRCRESAISFIMDGRESGGGAFDSICEIVGVDPWKIRKRLEKEAA